MANITTHELDDIARLGLDDMRECFSKSADESAKERAELALRILAQGTRRMSAETNRAAVGFKLAKGLGLPSEAMAPLWGHIVPPQLEPASSGKKR